MDPSLCKVPSLNSLQVRCRISPAVLALSRLSSINITPLTKPNSLLFKVHVFFLCVNLDNSSFFCTLHVSF